MWGQGRNGLLHRRRGPRRSPETEGWPDQHSAVLRTTHLSTFPTTRGSNRCVMLPFPTCFLSNQRITALLSNFQLIFLFYSFCIIIHFIFPFHFFLFFSLNFSIVYHFFSLDFHFYFILFFSIVYYFFIKLFFCFSFIFFHCLLFFHWYFPIFFIFYSDFLFIFGSTNGMKRSWLTSFLLLMMFWRGKCITH